MNRQSIDKLLIVTGTVSGAIACVWWTNSLLPLLAIAVVTYIATLQSRTDNGEALSESETSGETGAQRRTRRRDDE